MLFFCSIALCLKTFGCNAAFSLHFFFSLLSVRIFFFIHILNATYTVMQREYEKKKTIVHFANSMPIFGVSPKTIQAATTKTHCVLVLYRYVGKLVWWATIATVEKNHEIFPNAIDYESYDIRCKIKNNFFVDWIANSTNELFGTFFAINRMTLCFSLLFLFSVHLLDSWRTVHFFSLFQ